MGSISRMFAQKRFIEKFGEKIEEHFQPRLEGKTVVEITDIEANYYIKGNVVLSDGEIYPVHFRWAGQEEDAEGVELDEDFTKMEDYYKKHIIGKEIKYVEVNLPDRDDEVYVLGFVEEGITIEIPVGYDPEKNEISSYAGEIISQKECSEFENQNE
jgi:hypothetical protein